ncbi:MAG: hypothetical protein ACTSSF_00400 [Candidatus Heimdallarchaeaceae archaeon]
MKNIKNIEDLKEFLADYEELKRLARSLHNLYTQHCNYGLTPRQEKRVIKLEKKVKEIAKKWGLHVDICSDPRGMPLCLHSDKDKLKYWRYDGIVIPLK